MGVTREEIWRGFQKRIARSIVDYIDGHPEEYVELVEQAKKDLKKKLTDPSRYGILPEEAREIFRESVIETIRETDETTDMFVKNIFENTDRLVKNTFENIYNVYKELSDPNSVLWLMLDSVGPFMNSFKGPINSEDDLKEMLLNKLVESLTSQFPLGEKQEDLIRELDNACEKIKHRAYEQHLKEKKLLDELYEVAKSTGDVESALPPSKDFYGAVRRVFPTPEDLVSHIRMYHKLEAEFTLEKTNSVLSFLFREDPYSDSTWLEGFLLYLQSAVMEEVIKKMGYLKAMIVEKECIPRIYGEKRAPLRE